MSSTIYEGYVDMTGARVENSIIKEEVEKWLH